MNRIQATLLNQLQETHYRVERELFQKQEELRLAKKEREDCGVELYGVQQQLAQQQQKLESTNEEITHFQNKQDDTLLDNLKVEGLKLHEKLKSLEKYNSLDNAELGESLEIIRQGKKFNQIVKNEVTITRKIASKGQDLVKGLEKEKHSQDLYINDLNEKIRCRNVDIELYMGQLSEQKILTNQTKGLLQETASQLAMISSEKKHLVQEWNSSLVALGKRDEALTSTLSTLNNGEDKIKDQSSQLSSLIQQISEINNEIETEAFHHNRLDQERKFIENQIDNNHSDQISLALQFEMLQKNVEKTQGSQSKIELNKNEIYNQISCMARKCEFIVTEQKVLEEKIKAHKHNYNTLSQATIDLLKVERIISSKIHDKEIEKVDTQNELIRLKIDSLNTQVHNTKLQERLNVESRNLNEVDRTISHTEIEIKRRNSEIESKMNKIDRLNRKYELMVNDIDEHEPLGPLEAMIKNLQKGNELKEKKIYSLQNDWVTTQTKCIQTMSEIEGLQYDSREYYARLNILKQKKIRLLQETNANDSALKVVESKVKGMHKDIAHLNEFIGESSQQKFEIENETSVNKVEQAEVLKEIEKEVEKLEIKIGESEQSKDGVLVKLLDVERQILSWEKKIQLEKDTHAALNSSEHVNQTKGMEKEIHRMHHRLELINYEEERMIREMELAVHKREDIAVKYQNAKHDTFNPKLITIAEMKKKKNIIRKKQKENQQIKMIAKEVKNTETDQYNLEAATNELKQVKAANQNIIEDINTKNYEKQRLLSKSDWLKQMIYMFDFDEKGLFEESSTLLVAEKDLAVSIKDIRRIQNVIAGLRIKNRKYDYVFKRLDVLASDVFMMKESLGE